LVNPKQWVHISNVLLSFSTRRNVTINSIILISVNHVINHANKAKQSLDVTNETIGM